MSIFWLFFLVAIVMSQLENNLTVFAGYIIGTFLLNLDLDTKTDVRNSWGFLAFWWKPYDILVPHRVKGKSRFRDVARGLGHHWLMGPILLICWFLLGMALFYIGASFIRGTIFLNPESIDNTKLVNDIMTPKGYKFLFGIWFANIIHLISDKIK